MKIQLNEAQIKVALRDFVQQNIESCKDCAWGLMSAKNLPSGERLQVELDFPDESGSDS